MPSPPAPPCLPPRWAVPLGAAVIAGAALAAYGNSLGGAFVLDDVRSIVENPTIRQLWPLSIPLHPPQGDLTVNGRPLLNLSFAANYALGGLDVRGYHLLNLAIHLLAGLTLFGIARRTLLLKGGGRKAEGERTDASSEPTLLAFAIALLWTVHPLQTEAVTYVVQRAESLMGLFYLLTLYFFIRSVEIEQDPTRRPFSLLQTRLPNGHPPRLSLRDSASPRHLRALRFVAFRFSLFSACLAGMATKEAMASAPLLVLLYDRTFVSGSFAEAWARHKRVFFALGGTWLLLGLLMGASGGNRGRSVGFGLGISAPDHVLTQIRAVAIYLRLALWPHPLVFDYGTAIVTRLDVLIPAALLVAGLAAGTIYGLVRHPAWGFLGTWFFAVLAPSCLLPVTTQPIAEHRMYLPLAAVLAAGIVALRAAIGRIIRPPVAAAVACLALAAAGAAACGALTARRNQAYRSAVALWGDNLAKRPASPRAHRNLGTVLLAAGRPADALAEFTAALDADPADVEALKNEGSALDELGRRPEAIAAYAEAVRLKPDYAEARSDLGLVLLRQGRPQEAVDQFTLALRINPRQAVAHFALGNLLARSGRDPEAIAHFQASLADRADNPEAHNNLANALMRTGHAAEALSHYREALRLRPGYADAHYNLGNALVQAGRLPDALVEYSLALEANPRLAEAENNLGNVLLQLGRTSEALPHFESALRLDPGLAEARATLARLRGYGP
jgi:tetratricopeptide (TPR) repeat protein